MAAMMTRLASCDRPRPPFHVLAINQEPLDVAGPIAQTVHRTHVRALSDDGTHVTFGWFEGTITSPGNGR